MNKVSLKKAIASGSWFECHAKSLDQEVHFRLRILAFERCSVDEIDPSLARSVTIEGILWLVSVEVVSLRKTPTDAMYVRYAIKLIDEGDFEFACFRSDLDQDKSSGLHRFSGWSDNPPLSPKIKARGAIPFVLPDEENNYYVALNEGDIVEA